MLIDRVINNLKERRDKVLNGEVNCIPSSLSRFREDFVGVEQGKYYLISAGTKAGKSQISNNLFIYDPLFYAYNNPDKVHLKIFYFPLEETPEAITLRFMAHLLFKLSKGTIRVGPQDLKSTNENNIISDEILELLQSEKYKSILDFYEETVMFFPEKNPTGIMKQVKSYADKNGDTFKKNIEIVNKETGATETREVFDYYKPHDPKEYVLIYVDHVSLLDSESGLDLRQTINKFSEYMIYFRNRYNYSPVIVQQQNLETLGLEAFKANKIRPTMAALADSKATGKDCTVMLGITHPYSHEIPNYLGYDITKLKGNVRFLEVVLNREGQSNGIVALLFDGATCTIKELPKPDDNKALDGVYKYLDKIRNVVKQNKIFFIHKFKKLITNG